MQHKLLEGFDLLFAENNPAGVKAFLSELGLYKIICVCHWYPLVKTFISRYNNTCRNYNKSFLVRRILLFVSVFLLLQAQAQYKVTFKVTDYPAKHNSGSKVFVAGNFNNWNPQDNRFALSGNTLQIEVPGGWLEYKLTRGGWDKVEMGKGGTGIENRKLLVQKDTTVTDRN